MHAYAHVHVLAVVGSYATMLHPKASVIRNATTKVFNVRKRFAEIGMKGALAARQFDILDDNGDQTVDFTDLVGSYARIDGVTFEQAFAIAHLVMEAASVETSEMKKARAKLGVSASAEPNEGGSADDGSVLFGDAGAGIDFGKVRDQRSNSKSSHRAQANAPRVRFSFCGAVLPCAGGRLDDPLGQVLARRARGRGRAHRQGERRAQGRMPRGV